MQIILNRFINWQIFLNIINSKSKEGYHYVNNEKKVYEFEKDDSITYHYFMVGKDISKPFFNTDSAIKVNWNFFDMYPWKFYKKKYEVILYKIDSNLLNEEELMVIQENSKKLFIKSKRKIFDFTSFFNLCPSEVPNYMETSRASINMRLRFIFIIIIFGPIPFYILLTFFGIFVPSFLMIIIFGVLLDFEEIAIKKWDFKINEVHSKKEI